MSEQLHQPTHALHNAGSSPGPDTTARRTRACRRPVIAATAGMVIALVLMSAATTRAEVPRSGRYAVAAGSVFQASGGFSTATEYRGLTGELTIEVDTSTRRASITSSSLRYRRLADETRPFVSQDLIKLEELQGSVDENDIVHFVTPEGHRQDVDLTLTVEGDHLVLNGYYWEGCCDRFQLELDTVELVRIPRTRAGADKLLLRDGRFEVSATWQTADDRTGKARVASLKGPAEPAPAANDDAGVLYFFSPDNWELMVKVLDGCAINGHLWVLTAGSTTAGYELTVHDTWSDQTMTYTNPVGTAAGPELDTAAFTACDLEQPEP